MSAEARTPAPEAPRAPTDKKLFTGYKSTWCPGCGDFGVLEAAKRAYAELGYGPDDVVMVAGIGCSGRIGAYFKCYALHVTHGRTLPVATAVRMADPERPVLVAGGDGDAYAIGLGHFLHAVRRNIDVTYMVMDNEVYGLTLGQKSPTAQLGLVTKTSPEGVVEHPVRPLPLALITGATFVAQAFSGEVKQLAEILKAAARHKGFALVNILSPCVTYNKVHSYDWARPRVRPIPEGEWESADFDRAMKLAMEFPETIHTGVLYQTRRPIFEELKGPRKPVTTPDVFRPADITPLLEELY
ncbi:MAG: thiamine pyrophosphate-dependent enzyme [Halobacteria archaeon]